MARSMPALRTARAGLLCLLLATSATLGAATTPPFSARTLQGVDVLAVVVEDLDRELAVYGLDAPRVRALVLQGLADAAFEIVPYDDAVTRAEAALLRIRVLTNHDGHGFYHLSVKFELRRKVPLAPDPGAGFVSQAVWTDARNGVMLASEVEKITALVSELLGEFRRDHARQNTGDGTR